MYISHIVNVNMHAAVYTILEKANRKQARLV